MANNGGVVKTWTANNASSVTGTYADWYSTGDTEWIIEVTGTTSTGTTVTWNGAVRVAKNPNTHFKCIWSCPLPGNSHI